MTTPLLACVIRSHIELSRLLGSTCPLELGTKVQTIEAAFSWEHKLVAARAIAWGLKFQVPLVLPLPGICQDASLHPREVRKAWKKRRYRPGPGR